MANELLQGLYPPRLLIGMRKARCYVAVPTSIRERKRWAMWLGALGGRAFDELPLASLRHSGQVVICLRRNRVNPLVQAGAVSAYGPVLDRLCDVQWPQGLELMPPVGNDLQMAPRSRLEIACAEVRLLLGRLWELLGGCGSCWAATTLGRVSVPSNHHRAQCPW
jgi:hypothetical protein